MKFYAGIGSRQTPQHILNTMTELATKLREEGWTLRSGGAEGADTAFAEGAQDNAEILRPHHATTAAIELARDLHPAWDACSEYARKLHGRNSQIILGSHLNQPVSFVVAYQDETIKRGGTRLGMMLAQSRGIPVFNLWRVEHLKRVRKWIDE